MVLLHQRYEICLLNNGTVRILPGKLAEMGSFSNRTRLDWSLCIKWFASELCFSVTVLCCSAGFMTTTKIKQRVNLKFLVKLKKKKKSCRNNEAISALEDTHFTENENSKAKQVANESTDDNYFLHQR
jgi:hypothetical protein